MAQDHGPDISYTLILNIKLKFLFQYLFIFKSKLDKLNII